MLEGLHVAGEHILIQPQLGRAAEQLVCVKIAPQRVASLLEEGASVVGVALGPEVGHHFVAAQAVLARRGEQGEQGERLAVGGGARDRNAVILDRQPAKRPEFQHRAPFDPLLTRH